MRITDAIVNKMMNHLTTKNINISGASLGNHNESNENEDSSDLEITIEVPVLPLEEDDAYDTDLEFEDIFSKQYQSLTADGLYLKACEQFRVIPASYFITHMFDETLSLAHHGLGPNGAKAISASLVVNTSILDLNLEDNWITAEGMKDISEMLVENCYISSVNIAWNKLGSDGARYLCETIQENTNLRELNASRNDFCDSDAAYFSEALKQNFRLKHLNLSGNQFCETGGEWIGQAIANNEAIEHLDLSWNHFRRKGALAICAGMTSNITIKWLDLSWNGFADDGAMAMGVALKTNNSLQWLDMSNNRISEKGAVMLAKGLEVNDTLRSLKLGSNPFRSPGAIALIKAILKNENSAVEELDLKGIYVNEEFLSLAQEVREKMLSSGGSRTNFYLQVDHADNNSLSAKVEPHQEKDLANDHEKDHEKDSDDPMQLVQEFLQENKLRSVDLFRHFDQNHNWRISPAEFRKGLVEAGIPITKQQIHVLMNRLDTDDDGLIDYGEFLEGRKFAAKSHKEYMVEEAKAKEKIEEEKKIEAERFTLAWQDAIRAVTPSSSREVLPNHPPLKSRSFIADGHLIDKEEHFINQATSQTSLTLIPKLSRSFVQ